MNAPIGNDRIARFVQMTGRESATLEELGQRLADGESLAKICAAWDVPHGRMLAWLMADAERYGVYERSLELAAHALVAETVAIADNSAFEAPDKRVRIDTRFRVAQYHAPGRYGKNENSAPSALVLVADLDRVADMLLGRISGRTIEQPRLAEEASAEARGEGEI